MKTKHLLLVISLFVSCPVFCQKTNTYKIQTIAFYNLENLFDTIDDPLTYDDDKTPSGKDHWTEKNYRDKINHMSEVLKNIGNDINTQAPVILGVAEIENKKVLMDLINNQELLTENYGIIHYDSPDRRGIDVALLYKKDVFRPKNSKAYELIIYDYKNPTKRQYTRDQLLVSGYLDGELIHVIVNHWPSRRGGETRSSYKREKAAALNRIIIDSLFSSDPYAKIITMGDLNDDPNNKSIKTVLGAKQNKKAVKIKGLFNPMGQLAKKGIGSLAYRDRWNLFDQIIISKAFLSTNYQTYRYYKAGVFHKKHLTNKSGKYKGYPFRSFANGSYTGGYSDHFPVYIYLIKTNI